MSNRLVSISASGKSALAPLGSGGSFSSALLGLGLALALALSGGSILSGCSSDDNGDGGGSDTVDTVDDSKTGDTGGNDTGGDTGGATCGDGICNGDETCTSCEADCGACPVSCGDGTCNGDETCDTCEADCGACPTCGDGTCDAGEDCDNCVDDCACAVDQVCNAGVCEAPDPCGDGTCDADGGEDCASCEADCGPCPTCGDGTCNGEETCEDCAEDCGACPLNCGDGTCDDDETCTNCPADCGACPTCGDGTCNGEETCEDCAEDCGACPTCGDGTCNGDETCEDCEADCGACPNCDLGAGPAPTPGANSICQISGCAGDTVDCAVKIVRQDENKLACGSMQGLLTYDTSKLTATSFFAELCVDETCFESPLVGEGAGGLASGHSAAVLPAALDEWAGEVGFLFFNVSDPTKPMVEAYLDAGGSVVGDATIATFRFTLEEDIQTANAVDVKLPKVNKPPTGENEAGGKAPTFSSTTLQELTYKIEKFMVVTGSPIP